MLKKILAQAIPGGDKTLHATENFKTLPHPQQENNGPSFSRRSRNLSSSEERLRDEAKEHLRRGRQFRDNKI